MTDAAPRHRRACAALALLAAAACSSREPGGERAADTPAVSPAAASARAADAALRAAAARQDSLLALGDARAAAGPAAGADSSRAHAPGGDVARDGSVAADAAPTPEELRVLRGELAMPLAGIDPSTLVDSFNEARGGGARTHEALDIPAPRGTPVLSAASGRVLRLYQSRDGGNMVYAADSSGRFVLMYAHLDGYAPGLADGQPLRRGQPIGVVGTTGNAPPNVPHLHFAVARVADVSRWWTGAPVDPLPLLR